ncbi:hypothetical protein ACFO0N_08570 [Halobium salinum]|uniref:Uncharacterized protein n=1 Tax=Halobium salinum TaxID=1364940 RepID=A0ABD5PBB8_9EURY|nr:hypothetical protein [Halobium salinum]
MVSEPNGRRLLLVLLVGVTVGAVLGPSVNALPGFSDHTGPSEMRVTSFERLDAGCEEQVGNAVHSSTGGGGYSRTAFIRTADTDANLSVQVRRTSPAGADLSVFHVDVDSHHDGPANTSCETGVVYRVALEPHGGSDEGLVPDAHGTEVLWFNDGELVGCSASLTSPLESTCDGVGRDEPRRVWANGTGG